MKILWCDDQARMGDAAKLFKEEWGLESSQFVSVVNDTEALEALRADGEIGLLILDLLWDGQPAHPTTVPTGLRYLEVIRSEFPNLYTVTRSQLRDLPSLAAYIARMADLHVQGHFLTNDVSDESDLRRRLVLKAAEVRSRGEGMTRLHRLRGYLGNRWASVLFADISGFTSMTEELWNRNRDALCEAMIEFYSEASKVVQHNGGVVDKFIGDEVMAVFFEEKSRSRSVAAESAVEAARELFNKFRELERRFRLKLNEEDDALPDMKWGLKIGIEAGSVQVLEQSIGGDDREICILGHCVNFAARIKGLTGDYVIAGGPKLQGELRGKYKARPLENPPELKGIPGKFTVYLLD